MYITILVLVIALLAGAVGFIAAWIIQSRTLQQLRRDTEEEIMIWRETCEEIEQEASGFREHAEALERRLGSAHNVGRERIVALEAEIAWPVVSFSRLIGEIVRARADREIVLSQHFAIHNKNAVAGIEFATIDPDATKPGNRAEHDTGAADTGRNDRADDATAAAASADQQA